MHQHRCGRQCFFDGVETFLLRLSPAPISVMVKQIAKRFRELRESREKFSQVVCHTQERPDLRYISWRCQLSESLDLYWIRTDPVGRDDMSEEFYRLFAKNTFVLVESYARILQALEYPMQL